MSRVAFPTMSDKAHRASSPPLAAPGAGVVTDSNGRRMLSPASDNMETIHLMGERETGLSRANGRSGKLSHRRPAGNGTVLTTPPIDSVNTVTL